MARQNVPRQLADRIATLARPHPVRVAIDGIDASGKTTLAGELADVLGKRGLPVIHASLDGFHRPRSDRYRQGADSARGYYEDCFDYAALRTALLCPLGPGGNRRYRRATFDFERDVPLEPTFEIASDGSILLLDGVFLLRPELADAWDYRVFVDVSFDVALTRAMMRDRHLFGTPDRIRKRYLTRYFPAQQRYLETVRPPDSADAIVANNNPERASVSFRKQPDRSL
ncbi:MAG TPA: uridine kinase [Chloroflexota bacterium]|nr:uridine kinase [Chloroflexota bacterium]